MKAMTEPCAQNKLAQAKQAARAGLLDEADALLAEVLAGEQDNVQALDLCGFVRFFQGRFAEAEGCCRRVLELDPQHAYAHKGLGLCLARQGRLDEGVAELEQAIRLKPWWLDPYWDLAVVLDEGGRPGDALKVLARGQVAVPAVGRQRLLGLAARIRARLEGQR